MYPVKLFWEDPYLTETTAIITGVGRDGVTVDRTVAFAFSGGQESDRGTINGREIVRAEKRGCQIFYLLGDDHGLAAGEQAVIKIDWNRRYKLMRLHFAAELILELMNQRFGNPEKTGAHIAEEKARVDFAWQGNITSTFPLLHREASALIARDLPIASFFSDAEQELRCWEIAGFARVPCGGTHLRTTGEVGNIALRRNNIGKGRERIEITLV